VFQIKCVLYRNACTFYVENTFNTFYIELPVHSIQNTVYMDVCVYIRERSLAFARGAGGRGLALAVQALVAREPLLILDRVVGSFGYEVIS